jgi:flagellar hook-basal body complex protein FliE
MNLKITSPLAGQSPLKNQSLGTDTESSGIKSSKGSFADALKDGMQQVNKNLVESDQKTMDLASGKSTNIHETMIALSQAELGFQLMTQIRNKALEAYQEVMRMQA